MTNSLTICMTTSRQEPEVGWMLDSLAIQFRGMFGATGWENGFPPTWTKDFKIIVVDFYKKERHMVDLIHNCQHIPVLWTQPKPSVWQGEHRLVKDQWWDVCNARNTALALCQTDWIAFVDDRCVLSDHWLQSVREAMEGKYIVAGAYEKRHNMRVENGVIIEAGTLVAEDCRFEHGTIPPSPCP